MNSNMIKPEIWPSPLSLSLYSTLKVMSATFIKCYAGVMSTQGNLTKFIFYSPLFCLFLPSAIAFLLLKQPHLKLSRYVNF